MKSILKTLICVVLCIVGSTVAYAVYSELLTAVGMDGVRNEIAKSVGFLSGVIILCTLFLHNQNRNKD